MAENNQPEEGGTRQNVIIEDVTEEQQVIRPSDAERQRRAVILNYFRDQMQNVRNANEMMMSALALNVEKLVTDPQVLPDSLPIVNPPTTGDIRVNKSVNRNM